jgi:hypothetical protein
MSATRDAWVAGAETDDCTADLPPGMTARKTIAMTIK